MSGEENPGGRSYNVDGITVLDLNGTWHQMGMQYGVVAKEQMKDVLAYIDLKLGADAERTDAAAATVGYAGEIYCVNGLNAKGLFVELNNGMPSAGSEIHWNIRSSTASLFNMLFEAGNIDDADAFFKSTQSSLSSIIGVADRNEARSYEWCYDGVRRGDAVTEDGLMISTSHYVNGEWPSPKIWFFTSTFPQTASGSS